MLGLVAMIMGLTKIPTFCCRDGHTSITNFGRCWCSNFSSRKLLAGAAGVQL
jgi:hypothetical protein